MSPSSQQWFFPHFAQCLDLNSLSYKKMLFIFAFPCREKKGGFILHSLSWRCRPLHSQCWKGTIIRPCSIWGKSLGFSPTPCVVTENQSWSSRSFQVPPEGRSTAGIQLTLSSLTQVLGLCIIYSPSNSSMHLRYFPCFIQNVWAVSSSRVGS